MARWTKEQQTLIDIGKKEAIEHIIRIIKTYRSYWAKANPNLRKGSLFLLERLVKEITGEK